jgi:hypothetical protein
MAAFLHHRRAADYGLQTPVPVLQVRATPQSESLTQN